MRVSRDIPIHGNAKPALEALCDLLDLAEKFKSTDAARIALRAFIAVRRKYNPSYGSRVRFEKSLTPKHLAEAIESFVSTDSEGGKRAQAAVAGLMDMFAGSERVETSRINDPDRHLPGDVGVHRADGAGWERIFEVRDKPVSSADLYHFAQKAITAKVGVAALVAAAKRQQAIDEDAAKAWAEERGVSLTIFHGWPKFVDQVIFWSTSAPSTSSMLAIESIYARIIELEVSKRVPGSGSSRRRANSGIWQRRYGNHHERSRLIRPVVLVVTSLGRRTH